MSAQELPTPRVIVRLEAHAPLPSADTWSHLPPHSLVRITGAEPLLRPDLPAWLGTMGAAGLAVELHTALPGLHDDLAVRPFQPHDVRFRVTVPTMRAEPFTARTGGDLEEVSGGLRNLRAFGFPTHLEVPVDRDSVHELDATIAALLDTFDAGTITLRAVQGDSEDDPAWARSPDWQVLAERLRAYDATTPRPRPRLLVIGVPTLALPIASLSSLHLPTDDPPTVPWQVPAGYLRHHADPHPGPDVLARRRIWLGTPPRERDGFRGDPRDRLDVYTSVVLLRPGHEVRAVVGAADAHPHALHTAGHHALYLLGRFSDPVLQARLVALCREARQRPAPTDLGRLRALAHVLRRSLKTRHDDEPVAWREEETVEGIAT